MNVRSSTTRILDCSLRASRPISTALTPAPETATFRAAALRACLTLLLALAPLFATAQPHHATASPTPSGVYKLLAVKVTGSTRYTDKEILPASGLQLGHNVTESDFQEASRRLGNSGLFTEVLYSFTYSDAGAKVDFHVTDADTSKFVPARFENFVWFSDADLRAALAQRVPLFKDSLPPSGQMLDQISQALQALLDERHLPGRVDYLHEANANDKLTAIVYRLLEVSIRIRNVEFPGATPEQAAFLASGARKLKGAQYLVSALTATARYDLLPLCLQRGYLKADFAAPQASVIPPSETQPESDAADASPSVLVDAILPVTPGAQYLVSAVTWQGNAAIKTDEAAPLLHLPLGQPADANGLAHDLDILTALYRSRGYMAVVIKPNPQFDDAHSTVQYEIQIAEGAQYTMGDLDFTGVDNSSKDRLRAAWALREGQPYNADYARKFIETAVRLLPKGPQYLASVSEDLDAKSKTVDVTIHFKTK